MRVRAAASMKTAETATGDRGHECDHDLVRWSVPRPLLPHAITVTVMIRDTDVVASLTAARSARAPPTASLAHRPSLRRDHFPFHIKHLRLSRTCCISPIAATGKAIAK